MGGKASRSVRSFIRFIVTRVAGFGVGGPHVQSHNKCQCGRVVRQGVDALVWHVVRNSNTRVIGQYWSDRQDERSWRGRVLQKVVPTPRPASETATFAIKGEALL